MGEKENRKKKKGSAIKHLQLRENAHVSFNDESYLPQRELHMLSLRSLAFACLNMRREDAFSANA